MVKATRVPSVNEPAPTASAPSRSTMARVTFGITSRKVKKRDASRTLSIETRWTLRATASNSENTCGLRPNALTVRMPTAASST